MDTLTDVSPRARSGVSLVPLLVEMVVVVVASVVVAPAFALVKNASELTPRPGFSNNFMPAACTAKTALPPPGVVGLQAVRAPVLPSLRQLDRKIIDLLYSDTPLIAEVSSYLLSSQGKRLRPTMLLLAAGVFQDDVEVNSDAVALAAVVEFIHCATLLHDDVVDASQMRRGKLTANQLWGNESSVLVGDFLYSRAFQTMVRHAATTPAVMAVFADATNRIAEGEVRQLANRDWRELHIQYYLDVIAAKTACLFAAAARIGAMISGANDRMCQQLADCGMAVGMAYQLVDDILDYDAELSEIGKNPGDDLRNGKITMPLLYSLQSDGDILRCLLDNPDSAEKAVKIIGIVRGNGSIERTMQQASSYTDRAKEIISSLPACPCKFSLQALAEFSLHRRF